MVDEQVLTLGILNREEHDAMSEEEDRLYSFHHKLFHEFTASHYVARVIEGDEEGFQKLFPDWKTLCDNREVLGFAGEILSKDNWNQIAKTIEAMYTKAVQKVVEEVPQTDKYNQKINSRVLPCQVQFLEVKQCILPYFGTKESREVKFLENINYVCLGQRTNEELMSISCISMPGNADRYIFAHTVSVHDLKLMLSFHQGITHVFASNMLKGYGEAQQSNQIKYLFGDAKDAMNQFTDEQLTQRHKIKCIFIHQDLRKTYASKNTDVAFFDSYAKMLVNCDSLKHFHLSACTSGIFSDSYYCFYEHMSDKITSDIKLSKTLSSIKLDTVYLSLDQVKALMGFVADQVNPTKELQLKQIVLKEEDTPRAVLEILDTNVIKYVSDLNVFYNIDIDRNPVTITQGCFDCVILPKPTRQCIEIDNVCLREKARLIVDSLSNGALNKLQVLTLYKCDIPASVVAAIATELECHPCEVNLEGNAFCEIDQGHTNATLLDAVKTAKNVLIYPNGAITTADINGAISTELCPNLKHVKLAEPSEIDEPIYGIYDEGMYDECLDALINDIIKKGRVTLIQKLDVSKSLCSGNKLKDLLKQLHMCSNLKVLKTNENDLCNSVQFLTAEKHDNLHELHMEKCHLVREDIVALSESVNEGYFPQLGILNVRFNNVPENLVTSEIRPPLEVYSFNSGDMDYHYRDIWQKIAAEICFWYENSPNFTFGFLRNGLKQERWGYGKHYRKNTSLLWKNNCH